MTDTTQRPYRGGGPVWEIPVRPGTSRQGSPRQGVPRQGVPRQGSPRQGVPRQGIPRQGIPRQDTGRDQAGRAGPPPGSGQRVPRGSGRAGATPVKPAPRVAAQLAPPARRRRPAPAEPARQSRWVPVDAAAPVAAARTGVASPGDRAVPRVPFVLLVLALLGGSLVCLLVINTTLGAASFRISQLQHRSASLAMQAQNLRQQVAAEQAKGTIAARAYALGMRMPANTTILDLRSGQIYRLPGQAGFGVELGAPPVTPTTSPAAGPTPAPAATPTAGTTPAASPIAASPAPSASTTPAPAKSSP